MLAYAAGCASGAFLFPVLRLPSYVQRLSIPTLGLCCAAVLGAQEVQVPSPTGLLNDFAGVVDAAHAERITRIATFVRDRSKGEIAIVTLADIGTRNVGDIALKIGRDWGVGAKGEAGDPTKNAGVVVLLVPRETSSDGKGHISISTGRGVEGFLTDATTGDIRREATPLLQARDYGAALELITTRLAERYAGEYGFALDEALQGQALPRAPPPETRRRKQGVPWGLIFIVIIWLIVSSNRRGRGGCFPVFFGGFPSGGGGWSSGGGGGGFGGGSDFGGFGGGGGFSGGGSSGDF